MLNAVVRDWSGVRIPLFEASIPYSAILKDYSQKERDTIISKWVESAVIFSGDDYPGLRVGSLTTPNNNAGNWE